jgi:hypothetical protein
VDPAQQFDSGDDSLRRSEPFETQHRSKAEFHTAVILFDQAWFKAGLHALPV